MSEHTATRSEDARLAALHRLRILDTEAEEAWDHLVKLAAKLCDTPISLASLVDEHRQWFKARVGFDAQETPREYAFCDIAMHGDQLIEVEDASKDPRFADNPLVTGEPHIRFYAGAPLRDPEGHPLGTVCVMDRKPRRLDLNEREGLELIGHQAMRLIRTRLAAFELQKMLAGMPQDLDQEELNHIAHDMRTPMTPIMLQLANIKDGDDGKNESEIESIERNLVRLQEAMEQTLQALTDSSTSVDRS